MSGDTAGRLIFEAEWLDTMAELVKRFYLYYFPADNTIELVSVLQERKQIIFLNWLNYQLASWVNQFNQPNRLSN